MQNERFSIQLTNKGKCPYSVESDRGEILHSLKDGEGYEIGSRKFLVRIDGALRTLKSGYKPTIVYRYSASGRFRNVSGMIKHGMSNSMLYRRWHHACGAATNKKDEQYIGEVEGPAIETDWLKSSKTFMSWALANGYDEESGNTLLCRYDTKKGFVKGNCYWCNPLSNPGGNQCLLTLNGLTMSINGLARKLGMSKQSLWARLFVIGWSVEKALTTPPQRHEKSEAKIAL